MADFSRSRRRMARTEKSTKPMSRAVCTIIV
jgi:hypothetical protein